MMSRLRDWQFFLAAHAVFCGVALAPLLLGITLFSGIGLGHSYPFFEQATVQNFLSGALFMNRLSMNGFPSFIPIGFSTNPFAYLFTAILPPFTDLHWFTFANFVAGGVLCSLFLRRLNISRLGSLAGGICYMTGSWWLVVTPEFSPSMPMLPLAAMVLMYSVKKPLWALLWGSILCGYMWLGVPTQVTFMLFSAFGAGAVATCIDAYRRAKSTQSLRPVWVMILSIGFGTIIGIVKFLPAFVYGNLSWRASGVSLAEGTAAGIQPMTVMTYLYPYASFPFLNFGGELVQIFIGVFGFALLLAGIYLAFRRQASSMLRWWVGAYVFIFILAFAHSPLANLLQMIPPFSFFRGAGRWTMIGSFAVAPIIGIAFDQLMTDTMDNLRRKMSLIFTTLAGMSIAMLIGGQIVLTAFKAQMIELFQQYFAHAHASLGLGQPLSYYTAFVERRVQELVDHPLFLQPRALFPFLSLIILALIMQTRIWKKLPDRASVFSWAMLLTTAVTLMVYDRPFPRSALKTAFPATEWLQNHSGAVLSLFPSETATELLAEHRFTKTEEVQWTLAHLIPNTNFDAHIQTLDYFDNIAARRQTALANWVGAAWSPGTDDYRLVAWKGTVEEKTREFEKRAGLLNLQHTRYVLTSIPLQSAQFTKTFETKTVGDLPLMIYENSQMRPLAYFADSIVTMPESESGALRTMTTQAWPNHRSLIECEPTCEPMKPDGKGTVMIAHDSPLSLVLTTSTDTPQWLVVTVSKLPGWQVLLDGQPVRSAFANAGFFGIPVPAGSHTVELRFSTMTIMHEAILDLLAKAHLL